MKHYLVLLNLWLHFAAYYPTICSDQLLTGFHVQSVLWRLLKSDNVNTTVAVLLHRNMLERHRQIEKQWLVRFTFSSPNNPDTRVTLVVVSGEAIVFPLTGYWCNRTSAITEMGTTEASTP